MDVVEMAKYVGVQSSECIMYANMIYSYLLVTSTPY